MLCAIKFQIAARVFSLHQRKLPKYRKHATIKGSLELNLITRIIFMSL